MLPASLYNTKVSPKNALKQKRVNSKRKERKKRYKHFKKKNGCITKGFFIFFQPELQIG
jgi:hypothetical protein